eukprot:TRINITY_DN8909_c0_g1_i1.p1 TRINITY_DN8909_c0_g1~~TRINITY_DN8909_c0_g1_i1.p1  ORF type:complete len:444 (+),score=90.10 TRINITY_DN8909_c0_g1_i1:136-1467(+)
MATKEEQAKTVLRTSPLTRLLRVKHGTEQHESLFACPSWSANRSKNPCLCIAEDIWIGDNDGMISIFDAKSGVLKKRLVSRSESIQCLIRVSGRVWCGCGSGSIMILDEKTYKPIKLLRNHKQSVVAMVELEGKVYSGSEDFTVKIFDSKTFQELDTLVGHADQVQCLSLVDRVLCSGSKDGSIVLWDIHTLNKVDVLLGHTGVILSLCAHNKFLWSGSADGTIRIWDAMNSKHVSTLVPGTCPISVLISLDEYVVSGSDDGVLTIWNTEIFSPILTIQDVDSSRQSVRSLAVLDQKIVTAFSDCLIVLWNIHEAIRLRSPSNAPRMLPPLGPAVSMRDAPTNAEQVGQNASTWNLDTTQPFLDLQSYSSRPRPSRAQVLAALEALKRSEEKLDAWIESKSNTIRMLHMLKGDLDDVRDWQTTDLSRLSVSDLKSTEATNTAE